MPTVGNRCHFNHTLQAPICKRAEQGGDGCCSGTPGVRMLNNGSRIYCIVNNGVTRANGLGGIGGADRAQPEQGATGRRPLGPTAYAKSDIAGALRSIGYRRWGDPPVTPGYVPPEDLVVALMYSRDMRWINSAIPVVLCRGSFSWTSMAYAAKAYGFGGRLLGMIRRLRELGRVPDSREADHMLADCTPINPERMEEALAAYGC